MAQTCLPPRLLSLIFSGDMRFYTGVGSRETPPEVLSGMRRLAEWFRLLGFTLRSGGAAGADTAFEQGAYGQSHIYLSWGGFNGRYRTRLESPRREAYTLAQTAHPTWGRLSPGARALHARNCHQVLGDTLDAPSDFLVCWTPDGCVSEATRTKNTGGTATAIVLADRHAIPVFNLYDPAATAAVERFAASKLRDQS